jgi:hypothetical protein
MALHGIFRKIRSRIGIRSSKMAVRTHVPWYIRWTGTAIMMGVAAAIAWWLVDNSYRITGFNREEAKQQISQLTEDNQKLAKDTESLRSMLTERDRQVRIEKAAQAELAKNVAQLQDENSGLKEDLGFLRNIMSAGSVPEGLSVQNLKVEPDALPNEFRYRMLLIQGGQRKQDFKGKIQIIARVAQGGALSTLNFPEDAALKASGSGIELKYYQKVEGRFKIPEGALLKNVQVRIIGLPGGEVRTTKTLNIS